MKKKELSILIKDSGIAKKLIFNRITLTIVLIAALALAAQGYAAMTTDGHVEGVVIDQDGEPVSNATVEMRKHEVRTQTPDRVQTETDADGSFEFTGHDDLLEYNIVVYYDDEEVGSERFHNHFRGQNNEVEIEVLITESRE